MKSLLREPFFHFMVAGMMLFAIASALVGSDEREESSAIDVPRDELLAFVQNRTRQEDAETVARGFDALDERGRSEWVERFVREEALVREARRLGLDRDDDLIRRRLVQQMEFLAQAEVEDEITQADLEAHYAEHAEDYRTPARLTFTHVFVKDAGDFGSVLERAQGLLGRLERDRVTFQDAKAFGDRFLYNRNYVDRTLEEVASHFGGDFAEALLDLPLPVNEMPADWSGPFQSEHGWHSVLLTRRSESALPELTDVAGFMREEIRRERREADLALAVREIVSRYRVSVDPALGASAKGGATR